MADGEKNFPEQIVSLLRQIEVGVATPLGSSMNSALSI